MQEALIKLKDLTNNLIEEEIKNHSLDIKLKELQSLIYSYENKLNKLPETTIQLAQV